MEKMAEGKLQLKGDGFVLEMSYNPKSVTPEIEYTKITDSGLKRYWDGINRIVFKINNPKEKGKNEIVVTEVK